MFVFIAISCSEHEHEIAEETVGGFGLCRADKYGFCQTSDSNWSFRGTPVQTDSNFPALLVSDCALCVTDQSQQIESRGN
jgi:hypothetical protein